MFYDGVCHWIFHPLYDYLTYPHRGKTSGVGECRTSSRRRRAWTVESSPCVEARRPAEQRLTARLDYIAAGSLSLDDQRTTIRQSLVKVVIRDGLSYPYTTFSILPVWWMKDVYPVVQNSALVVVCFFLAGIDLPEHAGGPSLIKRQFCFSIFYNNK